MTKVVFLLVPRLHLLDLAGPAQVFSTAADIGLGYQLGYVSEQEDVPTAQGLSVRADTNWPDLGPDDLALHLVAVRHGPGAAARIAREMVVYARRNGDERQTSAMLRFRAHLVDAVHQAQDHIDARFADRLPLEDLAATFGLSERTLTRQFTEATGLTPLRYQQQLRVERAEHLIGHGATVEAAARAVGFTDARMLRRLRSRALI